MKVPALIFGSLAIVAAIMGIWVLVGVAAWIIRVIALILLVMAVLSARRKLTSSSDEGRRLS